MNCRKTSRHAAHRWAPHGSTVGDRPWMSETCNGNPDAPLPRPFALEGQWIASRDDARAPTLYLDSDPVRTQESWVGSTMREVRQEAIRRNRAALAEMEAGKR